jgi:acetyl-CoA carboxylase carboxyltransferase component
MSRDQPIDELLARIHSGGHPRYHEKNASQHKLFARERIARLVDPESFCEDGAFACARDPELAADAVITGTANIQGRAVAVQTIRRSRPGRGVV